MKSYSHAPFEHGFLLVVQAILAVITEVIQFIHVPAPKKETRTHIEAALTCVETAPKFSAITSRTAVEASTCVRRIHPICILCLVPWPKGEGEGRGEPLGLLQEKRSKRDERVERA